jgi:hypothetical protein
MSGKNLRNATPQDRRDISFVVVGMLMRRRRGWRGESEKDINKIFDSFQNQVKNSVRRLESFPYQ